MKHILKCDEATYQSLKVIVDYLLAEEYDHYEENDRPGGHIYEHAMLVEKMIQAHANK